VHLRRHQSLSSRSPPSSTGSSRRTPPLVLQLAAVDGDLADRQRGRSVTGQPGDNVGDFLGCHESEPHRFSDVLGLQGHRRQAMQMAGVSSQRIGQPAVALIPVAELTTMIEPPLPASIIADTAARMVRHVPLRLTSMTVPHCSSDISHSRFQLNTPGPDALGEDESHGLVSVSMTILLAKKLPNAIEYAPKLVGRPSTKPNWSPRTLAALRLVIRSEPKPLPWRHLLPDTSQDGSKPG
jgi:hypothetical protein